MANPDPSPARAAKARKRRCQKAASIGDARRALWRAVEATEAVLDTSDDPALTLKACHALTQSAAAYAKMVQLAELEVRIEALESHVT